LRAWEEHTVNLVSARPIHDKLLALKRMVQNVDRLVGPTEQDGVRAAQCAAFTCAFPDTCCELLGYLN